MVGCKVDVGADMHACTARILPHMAIYVCIVRMAH